MTNEELADKHILDLIRYNTRCIERLEALLLCITERLEQTPTVEDIVEAIKIAVAEMERGR